MVNAFPRASAVVAVDVLRARVVMLARVDALLARAGPRVAKRLVEMVAEELRPR